MHNARLAERSSFLGQVDVVPRASDHAMRVWCHDVSETGMFLQTTEPFRTGETVSLRFDVDQQEVHVRAAEVVWVRSFEPISLDGKEPGVGLRFISVDPPARAALRRLAHPENVKRDTIVDDVDAKDVGTGHVLPAGRLTLPPLIASFVRQTSGPALFIGPTVAGVEMSPISVAPFTQTPQQISLPPDAPEEQNLTSEARVFHGLPPAPRAVTMGPKRHSQQPNTQPLDVVDDRDVDLFVDWTFRRSLAPQPPPASEEEISQPLFHERFDDDAPLMMNKSVIEEPSILQSVSLVPNDSFTLGSLPLEFEEGALSIRHLPLLDERLMAPAKRASHRRRQLGAAVFLLAGCCAGAFVGVVHHNQQSASPALAQRPPTSILSVPTPAAVATLGPIPSVAPVAAVPAPLPPRSVEAAEAELNLAARALPQLAVAALSAQGKGVARIAKTEKAKTGTAEPEVKHSILASTTKPQALPALIASPGRVEIELPVAGKVMSVFSLSSPSRIVIDLEQARLPTAAIAIDEGGILQLRFGHPKPAVERVVVVVAGADKPSKPTARVKGERLFVTWNR